MGRDCCRYLQNWPAKAAGAALGAAGGRSAVLTLAGQRRRVPAKGGGRAGGLGVMEMEMPAAKRATVIPEGTPSATTAGATTVVLRALVVNRGGQGGASPRCERRLPLWRGRGRAKRTCMRHPAQTFQANPITRRAHPSDLREALLHLRQALKPKRSKLDPQNVIADQTALHPSGVGQSKQRLVHRNGQIVGLW